MSDRLPKQSHVDLKCWRLALALVSHQRPRLASLLASASLCVTLTFCCLTLPHRQSKRRFSPDDVRPTPAAVCQAEVWADSVRFCPILGSLLSFLPFSFTCLYFDLWLLDTNIDVIVMATELRPPLARTYEIITFPLYSGHLSSSNKPCSQV